MVSSAVNIVVSVCSYKVNLSFGFVGELKMGKCRIRRLEEVISAGVWI